MLASWLCRRSYQRFRNACHAPLQAQAARLREILTGAAATGFGRHHDFGELARIADPADLVRTYQARIPIRSHQQMREELEAVTRGNWQYLCPSRPTFFTLTAGSTGEYKRIPITAEFRRELGRGSLIVQGALEDSFPELRRLRWQFLVGSAEGGATPDGTPQGFSSGYNYKHLPWLVRRRFALPYWVFTLQDADERNYAIGRLLVTERRLGALCSISPVNLINVRRALERHADRLCDDVAAGTLQVNAAPAVSGAFRGIPDPGLARVLRSGRRRFGAFPTGALFPALRLLVCWQGGNMGYYRHELRACFGSLDTHEFPLSASEGLFAIACQPNRAGGVLAISTHFLEFLPESGGANALRADQLVPDTRYRLIITTSGGLYRYDMEDLVRVTGWSANTPVVEFISKASRQISVSNERLTEQDVTAAMQLASEMCGLWVERFLFVPCTDRRYRVLVDGDSMRGPALGGRTAPAARLADALEHALRHTSMGYAFERDDALLDPLEVLVTAPGELQVREAGGHPLPNAQVKPMHLTPTFDAHTGYAIEACHAALRA